MRPLPTTSLDDYRVLHPDFDVIPALITNDGDISAVGTAHGRTVPLIGSTRPAIFDVSLHPFDGGNMRIYADDLNDVLSVICGDDYRMQLDYCEQLIEQYDAITGDTVDEENRRQALHAEFQQATIDLCFIRGAFVHKARAVAQGKINDAARADGTWDALTDEEQEVLREAADIKADVAPVGVLEEALLDNGDGSEPFVGHRGVWRANVPLVLNEVDYYPWSSVPRPTSITAVQVNADGGGVETYLDTLSELNLRIIRVEVAEELFSDLQNLRVIGMTVRPALPVDSMFADYYRETTQARVERNRAEVAAKKKNISDDD